MGKYCGFWFGKSETQGKRHCPVCNELIPDNVSVCPYCDEPVDPVQTMAHVMTEKVISVHRCHAMVFAPWLAASVIAIIIIINDYPQRHPYDSQRECMSAHSVNAPVQDAAGDGDGVEAGGEKRLAALGTRGKNLP